MSCEYSTTYPHVTCTLDALSGAIYDGTLDATMRLNCLWTLLQVLLVPYLVHHTWCTPNMLVQVKNYIRHISYPVKHRTCLVLLQTIQLVFSTIFICFSSKPFYVLYILGLPSTSFPKCAPPQLTGLT